MVTCSYVEPWVGSGAVRAGGGAGWFPGWCLTNIMLTITINIIIISMIIIMQ